MLTSSSFFHIENRLGHFSSLSVPCLPSPQKNHILKRFKNIMVKQSRRAKVRGKNWGVCVCFLEVCWFCLLTVSIFEALNQIWSHCFGVFFWHQTHISSRGILQQPKVFVLDETFFVSKILTGCCFMPPSLSTFEVKLITSFIWFVHWTKKHIPTSLPETDKEKLACQSSSYSILLI